MLRNTLPLALLAATLACSSSEDPPVDTGNNGTPDSGVIPDSGEAPDTGEAPDSGVVDNDSGVENDSGTGPTCPESFVPSGVNPTCAPIGTELQAGTGPIRRGDMAFAVDQACGRVFMFHGDRAEPANCGPAASQFIDDGYLFEPSTGRWYTLEPTGTKPRNRVRGAGAWDAMRNRFILFGGRWRSGAAGAYIYQRDVWAYDPATNSWTELWAQSANGGPTGRMNTVMVADPVGDRVLLFGGGQVSADATSFIVDNQTWAFDLSTNTWSQLATTGTRPTARLFHVGAFDRNNRVFYIFGGGGADAFTSPTFFQDLWALDVVAGTWSRVDQGATLPAGRIKGEMDYDPDRNRLLLFGGHDDQQLGNDNDLWTFDLATRTWTNNILGDTFNAPAIGFCDFPADFAIVDQCSPERRESHLFRIFGDKAFMYGGRTDCGLTNDTWILDLNTHQWRQVNGSFNGMTCYRSGRTDCDQPDARKCG